MIETSITCNLHAETQYISEYVAIIEIFIHAQQPFTHQLDILFKHKHKLYFKILCCKEKYSYFNKTFHIGFGNKEMFMFKKIFFN